MFRAFLYVITSEINRKENKYKLGCTIHPVCRLYSYRTHSAPGMDAKKYIALWEVHAKNHRELLSLEKILHMRFNKQRLYHEDGGMSEWFQVDLEEILSFLSSQPFVKNQLSPEDIKAYNEESRKPPKNRTELEEEESLIVEAQEELLETFRKTFLPEKNLRRIQQELWDIIEQLCKREDIKCEKGIVQWPTGVGKTIGVLILIVLMKDWCNRNGKLYRGLFIVPKNDIYNTIKKDFAKLSEFGIQVYDGTDGKLSSLKIPTDKNILVVACHNGLVADGRMTSLPDMNHIHYDEVHRITGEQLFDLITKQIEIWKTNFVTGTSATPQTCSPNQRKKLSEMFGDPLTILHRCEVEEAVKEGWIARPRFIVRILPKLQDRKALVQAFVDTLIPLIVQKQGKAILYIESSVKEVGVAYEYAKKTYSDVVECFTAVDGLRNDQEFVKLTPTDKPFALFACQRYREGSDIRGLELTAKLTGDNTMAHILVQISGRALRADYEEKEGWCVIVRPCEEGTTEEEVLDSVILDIIDFMGGTKSPLTPKKVYELARTYFGEISVIGSTRTIEETIQRVQAAYVRREFVSSKTSKERYSFIQAHNKMLGIMSKENYYASKEQHPKYIEDPKSYFKDQWISWYHFLGVDTSSFPQTKTEWIRVCKDRGIMSWSDYKHKKYEDLPENPIELYEDFTNWDKEFGVEDEIVW